MRNLQRTESQVLDACIKRLHWAPEVVAWRNNTGGARPEDTRVMNAVLGMLARGDGHGALNALRRYAKRRGQPVRFGIKGQADITGYFTEKSRHVAPGTRLELEVKGPKGVLSSDQLTFLTNASAAGCVAACVDDVETLGAVLTGSHNDPKIDEQPF